MMKINRIGLLCIQQSTAYERNVTSRLAPVTFEYVLLNRKLPKCQLTKNHISFGQTEAWSRSSRDVIYVFRKNYASQLQLTTTASTNKQRLPTAKTAYLIKESLNNNALQVLL